jgi:hypothetical protein
VDENLRDRLAAELAEQPEPPLGDLVFDSLRQGKRLRLVRRAGIAGSALAAVAVFVVGLVLGAHLIGGTSVPPATHAPSPLLTTAPPTTTTSGIAQPAGPKSPTTLAAMAYRFAQLVPGGQLTSLYHSDPNNPYALQFRLDRGHGAGEVQIDIAPNTPLGTCPIGGGLTCQNETAPGGAPAQVIGNSTNCVETTSVSVDHGGGLVVTIYEATCLPWNGTTNPPCPPALTSQEAIAIAADPSWGTQMPSSLVAAADAKYSTFAIP